MQCLLKKLFDHQNILILGFGREGQSTYRTIRKFLPDRTVSIADRNMNLIDNQQLANDPKVVLRLGDNYLEDLSEYDLIIKTPGISLKHHPKLANDPRISSQADLFLSVFSSQTIGITGTKGKSTTTSLIYHIVQKYTTNVVLVGNIGIPPFDMIDQITSETLIVYELSSHQLQFIRQAPRISVLLNIFQEHLDYYCSYEQYQQSKLNIVRFQNENDFVIYNADNAIITDFLADFKDPRKRVALSVTQQLKDGFYIMNNQIFIAEQGHSVLFYDANGRKTLMGDHNLFNMMAAAAVCRILTVPDDTIQEGFNDFKSLPHRLEYVGNFWGIHFYNDSISTIPETTIAALKTIQNVDTLILGGFDRGIDYSSLIEFIYQHPIPNLIFIGSAGKRMHEAFDKNLLPENHLYITKTYAEVVDIAFKVTRVGKTCLLSPAAASYDMFTNFEERGTTFIHLIEKGLSG
ncbi:unnamed protein product [Rotaria sp. Silwood1]|nr:unnamed protein product [Rotaria sp. Silwood1]